MKYERLPVSLLGSPGAMQTFRERRMTVDFAPIAGAGAAVFGFLAAAIAVLLGVGWLRRLIGAMG